MCDATRKVPMSEGMLSKPQHGTILTPFCAALSWYVSMSRATHGISPEPRWSKRWRKHSKLMRQHAPPELQGHEATETSRRPLRAHACQRHTSYVHIMAAQAHAGVHHRRPCDGHIMFASAHRGSSKLQLSNGCLKALVHTEIACTRCGPVNRLTAGGLRRRGRDRHKAGRARQREKTPQKLLLHPSN